MNGNLPDLVRDYKLKTWYDSDRGVTIHEYNDPDALPLSPPRQECWKKVRKIGHGGQGEIVLETCIDGSRNFTERAVKKIRFQNNDTKQRYQRELVTMIRFSHDKYSKYFVKSLGWFASSEKLYIAMEYLPAGDLYNYVREHQHLPEDDCCQIATQLLVGLSLMHSESYSHRDIKPQNILIHRHPNSTPSGGWWVKIADFGISKRLGPDTSLTAVSIGTAGYMAPELYQSDGSNSPSNDYRPADVWALGITVFFILTNTVPFQDRVSTTSYARDHGSPFPHEPLDICQVSPDGQSFIREALKPRHKERLKVEEAKSHTWIQRLLPSVSASGLDSRPPTASSRDGSFDNEKELTTEIDTLATQSNSRDSCISKKAENHESLQSEKSMTTAEFGTKDSHQEAKTIVVGQEDHGWSQLITAVLNGDIRNLKAYLDRNGSSSMPMPRSVHDEEASLAKLLNTSENGWLSVKDEKGYTPIMLAAIVGHAPLTKLLIAAGADVEEMDNAQMTAFSIAIQNGHELVMELLLEKVVNIEGDDQERYTPLARAAFMGYDTMVKILLDSGANTEAKDKNGDTPLILAIQTGYETIISLLLDRGAKIEATDNSGWTPLSKAVINGHETIVKLLLDRGANIEAKSNSIYTPLLWATHKGYETIIKLLLDRGADIEAKSDSGWTPLIRAVTNSLESIVQLLLDRGANIEAKSNSGYTPLLWATHKGYETIINLLLDCGANIEARDSEGSTPLAVAAHLSHKTVVKTLLDNGADIETKNLWGDTPLMMAVKEKNRLMRIMLVQEGAEKGQWYYFDWHPFG